MTTQTESLRSLTLEVISNYRKTAKFATQALRSSCSRSIGKVDSTLTKYEGKFGEKVKSALDTTEEKIVSVTDKADEALTKLSDNVKSTLADTQDSIVKATDKADTAVDKLVGKVTKQINKYPPKTGKFADFLKNDLVKSVEDNIGVPSAKLVRFVTSKLADGAEELSIQIAGAKKKALPARKVVAKTTKTVKKPVRKVKAAA